MNDAITRLEASAYTVPTESPESDGTLEWSSTTLVLVKLAACGVTGIGYSYAHECCVPLIRKTLFPIIEGKMPDSIGKLWNEMNVAVRNFGRNGVASSAIAAVETALWDLKARLHELPFVRLIGAVRENAPVYGSGGFTSYSEQKLCQQLAGWVGEGISMVKMKIGREPGRDPARVAAARAAIGNQAQLFVDANGAYHRKEAMDKARVFAGHGVSWFEEPVTSDDLEGLHLVRQHAPMDVSAGEYNYDQRQALAMLKADAVDVLQADATRCGIIGFMQMSDLSEAFGIPLSSHTAPALHTHLACVARPLRHIEYFFDHVRIEQMFFEGATVRHHNGKAAPDFTQPGFGLEFKARDAEKFKINL